MEKQNQSVPALTAACFVAYLATALLIQYLTGANDRSFDSDATAHYASGALVHDYLAAGLPGNPVSYLTNYHAHYPIIGIGHWPPGFYAIEGLWMLLAGSSRSAALWLTAVVGATSATAIFLAARRVSVLGAAAAGLALLVSPVVRGELGTLMLDVPVALACFAAALAYAGYLSKPTALWASLFAVLASAAMLTKGNALCLALVPPFAILLTGRIDLVKRWTFWLPIPIVAVLGVSWYAATYQMTSRGFRYKWGLEYTSVAIAENSAILLSGLGVLLLASAILGIGFLVAGRRPAPTQIKVLAALALAVIVFQTVVPAAIQTRYLIPVFMPMLVVAVWAIATIGTWVAHRSPTAARALQPTVWLVALAMLATTAVLEPSPPWRGFDKAADVVWANRPAENPAVLIAADGAWESALVSELAMRDPVRPSLFAIRGSRLLGGGGFNTSEYVPRYSSIDEVEQAIDKYSIPLIVHVESLDHQRREWEHVRQLTALRERCPECWKPIHQAEFPGYRITVLRSSRHADSRADRSALIDLSRPANLKR